ncbi:MAG: sigma-70 family RNA polymerase sigma factor [Acidobacteriia bacterium]|nr:sigma-70 family RNA polymerase sigma factor [Terriglobia bacterium]
MAFEDASDIQLYQLASAGEEAAFVALYRRWQGSIYRFSLRIGSSASMAEDVTQEVFLALMNGASGFDPALGSFSSYVYGIARNHVLRRVTREPVFATIDQDAEADQRDLHKARSIPSDPLGELTRREMIEALNRAVATLPLRYREVVVLCELQELSYAEAARVVGCPEGTIRSRLHRARILLVEKLREKTKEDSRASGIEPARCLL